MRKLFFLIFIVLIISLNSSIVSSNEIIAPVKNLEELETFIGKLNINGIMLSGSSAEGGVRKDEVRNLSTLTGNFQLESVGGAWYRLFHADINNDAEKEYVLISYGGSGQWLDIDGVFKEIDGKVESVFDEVYMDLRKYFFSNPESDPQNSAIFEMHGDFIIKEINGVTYFNVISTNGYWYELQDDLKTVKKVEEYMPIFHKFKWDKKGLTFLGTEQREYKKVLDKDIQRLLEVDRMWLGMSRKEKRDLLNGFNKKESD